MVRKETSAGSLKRHNFSDFLRQQIQDRDGEGCNNCHRTSEQLYIHHLLPLSNGGSNSIDNLIVLCKVCHGYVHRGNIEKLVERALSNKDYY